ncbi:hypothetical protein LE134_16945, partial [Escherichia coli]|nr:hypothetical protein [Escherichia coli]
LWPVVTSHLLLTDRSLSCSLLKEPYAGHDFIILDVGQIRNNKTTFSFRNYHGVRVRMDKSRIFDWHPPTRVNSLSDFSPFSELISEI